MVSKNFGVVSRERRHTWPGPIPMESSYIWQKVWHFCIKSQVAKVIKHTDLGVILFGESGRSCNRNTNKFVHIFILPKGNGDLWFKSECLRHTEVRLLPNSCFLGLGLPAFPVLLFIVIIVVGGSCWCNECKMLAHISTDTMTLFLVALLTIFLIIVIIITDMDT